MSRISGRVLLERPERPLAAQLAERELDRGPDVLEPAIEIVAGILLAAARAEDRARHVGETELLLGVEDRSRADQHPSLDDRELVILEDVEDHPVRQGDPLDVRQPDLAQRRGT